MHEWKDVISNFSIHILAVGACFATYQFNQFNVVSILQNIKKER